jgi:peptide/nickel transport system permease protein
LLRYLFHRLWQSAVTLVLASIVVFVGVRALPGDPALAMAGENADPATIKAIRAQLGLDQSLPVQYLRFAGHALTGDFGNSTATGMPVNQMIGATLPVTIQLALYAMAIAVLAGMTAGVVAAVFRGRWPEWAANGFSLLALSVPTFWVGILAILYLSVQLGWFPASGYVALSENPLRWIYCLGSGAVILRYGLRNSLVVVTTVIGLQLGGLIAGGVVTERIFSLPGMGKLTLDSVFTRDYPVIQAVVLVVTAAYIVINLLIDLLYTAIDPRIRVSGRAQ